MSEQANIEGLEGLAALLIDRCGVDDATAFDVAAELIAYRLSDRLADERSASKSPNSSDPSAIAWARERPDQTDVDCAVSELHEILQYAELVDGPALPRVLQFPQVHVRTLLADHARLGGLVDELQGLLVTHEIAAEAKSRRALTNREGQDNE